MKNKKHIDAFVNIVDNFGDIGFAAEFCLYYKENYKNFFFHIFVNNPEILASFFEKNNIDNAKIYSINNFFQKSEDAISFLHADFPKKIYKKVFRVDYISLDDIWIENNFSEHIFSDDFHKIIEIIPSPKPSGSGILPKICHNFSRENIAEKFGIFRENHKIFSIFCYTDTFLKIDFENIPENVKILIFGQKNLEKKLQKKSQIHFLPIVSIAEMYEIFHFSDYILTRGEISFMQVLRTNKPFLWDLYHTIGGFPTSQSEDFLDFIDASDAYRNFSQKMWYKNKKISISEMIKILENEEETWKYREYKNFAEEMKKLLTK